MNEEQGDLFQAETSWFHVFRAMIESGDLAKMEGSDIKVYLCVKSYTNFSTGRAFPLIETIMKGTGLSDKQVRRCLVRLAEMGYIVKEKKGRKNFYRLREKVSINSEAGRPIATASWDYLPNAVKDAVSELKNMLVSGVLKDGQFINIENLTININKGNQLNINASDTLQELKKTNPSLAEKLENLLDKMSK